MTKDEARTILAMMASDRHEAEADALLMAIDALSVDGELISRADAIEAVCDKCPSAKYCDRSCRHICVIPEALSALPSAEAVSMEEHIKELNDLAVEWKAKFAKAEKITDEIYDETMAKVAKECEECKERLRSIRPSAEAENESCGTCKYFETSHREYPCSDCTVGNSHYVSAEAVQGEWIDIDNYYRMATCSRCHKVTMFEKWGEYTSPYDYCPNCGAKMIGGDDS